MDRSSDPASQPRKLIYFPIVHNHADLGALSESVNRASFKKIGRAGWKRKLDMIDQFWSEVEKVVDELPIMPGRVRIYQDGLPVSGREADIVRDLAAAGSRNHALIVRLMARGAFLMGTESPELLLEEYEMAKKGLEPKKSREAERREGTVRDSLLVRRDRFIALRINETLRPGDAGIVFLGMLHSLEPWIAKDIRVTYPLHRPVKS